MNIRIETDRNLEPREKDLLVQILEESHTFNLSYDENEDKIVISTVDEK